MTTQHTQGEWSAVNGLNRPNDLCVHSQGRMICEIPNNQTDSVANARLIAAAPDLLMALIECRKALRHYSSSSSINAYYLAGKAIEKATQP